MRADIANVASNFASGKNNVVKIRFTFRTQPGRTCAVKRMLPLLHVSIPGNKLLFAQRLQREKFASVFSAPFAALREKLGHRMAAKGSYVIWRVTLPPCS